jgi:hypothetical protein
MTQHRSNRRSTKDMLTNRIRVQSDTDWRLQTYGPWTRQAAEVYPEMGGETDAYNPFLERYKTLQDMARERRIPLFEPDQLCARGNLAYAALTKSIARMVQEWKES